MSLVVSRPVAIGGRASRASFGTVVFGTALGLFESAVGSPVTLPWVVPVVVLFTAMTVTAIIATMVVLFMVIFPMVTSLLISTMTVLIIVIIPGPIGIFPIVRPLSMEGRRTPASSIAEPEQGTPPSEPHGFISGKD